MWQWATDIGDAIASSVQTSMCNWFYGIFEAAWMWTLGISFWVLLIFAIIMLILFATTRDKKYSNKAAVAVVIYAVLQAIGTVI